ncbi:hypothetical protein ACVWZZ_005682 [Bradyrhizobium sp. LM6.10]
MILRLVARQRHQPGLGLSRDRWLLAWSRTIVEGRQRGRRPAPARHSVAPSDDRPKSMAHCAERRIFPIRQQHLRPRHPARQFDPRPPKCCQGRNLFIAHCPFDRSPPSCHDTAPRCADRKRGIRQQPVRSTNQPAPGAQASWNRSSRSCAGKRLFCGGGARPPCLSDDRLHWRSSWGAGGRADPRSCRAPLRPTMPIEPSCQRAPGGTRRRRSRFGASSIRTSPCTECARSGASSSAEIFHIARSTVSPLMRDMGLQETLCGKLVKAMIRQPPVPVVTTECPLALRLHLSRDLDRLRLRRLCHRRLCSKDRGLAGLAHDKRRLRARCAGAGPAAAGTSRGLVHHSDRGRPEPLDQIHRVPG